MKKELTFCEVCRQDVEFTVTEAQLVGHISGKAYHYLGKLAHCNNCKAEVYVEYLHDEDLRAMHAAYREANGLISLETVLAIPKKYAIGKRPLSLLLGWGELTFSRYYNGDIPTKQYSEILQHIFDDPSYYAEILTKNKSNLKTKIAYEKSKRAVDALLNKSSNINSKIQQVAQYLLNKCEDITPLALQKALYYAQGFYTAFYQKPLFTDHCEAWIHGPVYRDIYFQYRNYRFDTIEGAPLFDENIFTPEEKVLLNSIAQNICCYSGKTLEHFTHVETPWVLTRGELPVNATSERIITYQNIKNYFNTIKTNYQMETPNDIKKYTMAMFEQMIC